MHLTQPDQRGHIVRALLDGLLEKRCRLRQRPLGLVQMPEIIRPASVVRGQSLRIEEIGFGQIEVFRRHEQLPHLAIRHAELEGRRPGGLPFLHQLLELLAQLHLHRLLDARQLR